MTKIRRNEPCHCGSGLKFKRCHGRSHQFDDLPPLQDVHAMFERRDAAEHLRQRQQGMGKPIIGATLDGHQIVGVGNTLYASKTWKTVPDFLADYIKRKLDPAWGNAEIAKPLEERHPLMQWYDAYCRYQQAVIRTPGEVTSSPVTGLVVCYLGTAYALYLLDHNAELQTRLINRLKNPGNFQGAYYELIVASTLIRAGFDLTLEDEGDPVTKHCEFAAVSKRTGKKYWVEAKMRAVAGRLGRTALDGGHDQKPLKQLVPHLNKALAKPATDERLIFIDVNAPQAWNEDGKPDWLEPAMARLEAFEQHELKADTRAYVFVTNMTEHRYLDDPPRGAGAPFGLGMPEFNRPGEVRVVDAYRNKRKHIDAFDIGEALARYAVFPTTFDGRLPSEAFGLPTNRVLIGETYEFGDGTVGTVTTASVSEGAKEIIVGVTLPDGQSVICRGPMTDGDLAEYREAPDAYFGKIIPASGKSKDAFEMFEWLMEVNAKLPREKMLSWFGPSWNRTELEALSDDDLRMVYCEAHLASIEAMGAAKAAARKPTEPGEK